MSLLEPQRFFLSNEALKPVQMRVYWRSNFENIHSRSVIRSTMANRNSLVPCPDKSSLFLNASTLQKSTKTNQKIK